MAFHEAEYRRNVLTSLQPAFILHFPRCVLIQLCEMLFLTVPGGTASLQCGLLMGSPGMYFRGFVKGAGIRKEMWGGDVD